MAFGRRAVFAGFVCATVGETAAVLPFEKSMLLESIAYGHQTAGLLPFREKLIMKRPSERTAWPTPARLLPRPDPTRSQVDIGT